jgi:hypothetical protein
MASNHEKERIGPLLCRTAKRSGRYGRQPGQPARLDSLKTLCRLLGPFKK